MLVLKEALSQESIYFVTLLDCIGYVSFLNPDLRKTYAIKFFDCNYVVSVPRSAQASLQARKHGTGGIEHASRCPKSDVGSTYGCICRSLFFLGFRF